MSGTGSDSGHVVVIGAGPAGLSAAWELLRLNVPAVVFESSAAIGGLSRTENHRGYRFDIGGHRFFTSSRLVQDLWEQTLGTDLLSRPRLSRIHYQGKFFHYPLRPLSALKGLGALEALRVGFSYARARVFPSREEQTFEQWVVNRFGRRLFETFFKTYTEKVWGMPCHEIRADWAAQRIKDLDLLVAVKNAVFGHRNGDTPATLIDRFHYPRLGPGMMWERLRDQLQAQGLVTLTNSRVVEISHHDGRVQSVSVQKPDGEIQHQAAKAVISSMPLTELVRCLKPAAPPAILEAAARLRYRDFLTVMLVVARRDLFPDNWIYIHSPSVKVGRIQNFKNWSPEMVPDPETTSLGLEYFANRGDELWSRSNEELIELATTELVALGFATRGEIIDGVVVRSRRAYPVYDAGYAEAVATLNAYVASLSGLHSVGRNGQHRYNNQDHSMLTGIGAARDVAGGLGIDAVPEQGEDLGIRELEERRVPLPVAPLRAVQR